jgi:tRNA-splicing ligase RtcB
MTSQCTKNLYSIKLQMIKMEHLTITGKELLQIGFVESPVLAKIMQVAKQSFGMDDKDAVFRRLQELLANPVEYTGHAIWGEIAIELIGKKDDLIRLKEPKEYAAFGNEFIEQSARDQMKTAMRLPIAAAGALMPDAHQGYGLPIGGVLAAKNAIIPYGVGVDIGCRMSLSIYDISPSHFEKNQSSYKRELIAHTMFGAGNGYRGQYKADHEVLVDPAFEISPFILGLKERASAQLGTSGGGNHFVEFGEIEILEKDNGFNLPLGSYLALLTHSGSRGLGATIANHYTKLAKSVCPLPREAANLAYFDMDSNEGQEYWAAMNLAGNFASACHEIIHQKLTKAIGGQVLARVENHHNFAWKEQLNGEELIVHRKGATPAGEGVLGIIPGSMTAPGYLVKGKGNLASINSASHGAGRKMSRTMANKSFTRQQLNELLKVKGVTLIGGGTDEAPGAYKNIKMVMNAQQDLVDVLAKFSPKMVRMADDGSRED